MRLRPQRRKGNPLPREGVSTVDWKDTALLRKFISDRGKIRARRVTGLTRQQQREVATAIKNAREMALLPYPSTRQR
ncbi:30S ribosomal protein S18 [Kibdelosporangium philippinense]|uniref:Small ribosomal subunit protein bS18 n=1 Tax=Kibdelosporangium philippinense TaxID=211113 RepID=A0ABS8ZM52_9PSEU|nr:30S ribosomal protein S18 [Kibdelosporangium philippinense]MCE7008839.1 30S ribosomal protein S18 [Kibdelosporangium philippinense]